MQKSMRCYVASIETSILGGEEVPFFLFWSSLNLLGCSKSRARVSATSSIAVRPKTRQFYASSESNIVSDCVRLSKVEMLTGAAREENEPAVVPSSKPGLSLWFLPSGPEMLASRQAESVSRSVGSKPKRWQNFGLANG